MQDQVRVHTVRVQVQVRVLVGRVRIRVLKIWTRVGLIYTVGLEYYITGCLVCRFPALVVFFTASGPPPSPHYNSVGAPLYAAAIDIHSSARRPSIDHWLDRPSRRSAIIDSPAAD